MVSSDQVAQLQDHLKAASSIFVFIGSQPKPEFVRVAVSLTQALTTLGKKVELVCPDELNADQLDLAGEVTCRQKLGNQNLSISFDYDEQSVDKVSYHIDEERKKFFLVIKPQKGHSPLSTQSVSFDYTGAEADMLFLVGVHQLESLEHLYEGHEELFTQSTMVTLHTFEPSIGQLKLNLSGTSSFSEAAAGLLLQLQPELPPEAATNLLRGIESATDNFQSMMATADTFEMVAQLMKQGARRSRKSSSASAPIAQAEQIEQAETTSKEIAVHQEQPLKKSKKSKTAAPGSLQFMPGGGDVRK